MENASKAIIIAGGILLAMLLITLIIYTRNSIRDYYQEEQINLYNENIGKFNEQFTSYDRDTVYGYEIISLINKVTDYNTRFSTAGSNDQNYTPITISIYLVNSPQEMYKSAQVNNNFILTNFTVGTGGRKLFTSNSYIQNNTVHAFGNTLTNIKNLERDYGEDNLKNFSKAYSTLFEANDNLTKEIALKKFAQISSAEKMNNTAISNYCKDIKNYNEGNIDSNYTKLMANFENASAKYYEYMQFKKAVFKSDTVTYNNNSGRVETMKFIFTGKIE